MINELGIKNNTNNNTKNTYQNMTSKPKDSMLSIRNKCKLKQRCGLADTYVLDTSDALDPPLSSSTSSHYRQMVSSPFSQIFNLNFWNILWKGRLVSLPRKSWYSITAICYSSYMLYAIAIALQHKSSKSICSSDFANLYIKAPRYKLLEVLRENIGFTFKKG